ncbi:MAG: bifunctional riboflavin kinase/FAD synthetase [Clostridiales bacterium]|nr:bifunctional riboflavin kinase/FAD synthetase [Clostridiales bacterium]
MKILRDPKRMNPCVLVLGMFDGVHRGHQALLMRGVELAQEMSFPLCVMAFEPHPLRVIAPARCPAMLNTLPEKARIMQSFGVDMLCITTFDRARADQSPEDFMAEMVETYAPVVVVCGFNFTFGKGGEGTGRMLREYGRKHGFRTVIVPEVLVEGETVSSTRIRKLLAAGDIPMVNRLLGTGYTLSGRVEGGKQLGRTMGFPTANVRIPKYKALPAYGVYACWLETADGAFHPSVVNVGCHPTLPEGHVTVEAHVLTAPGESIELYGQHVRLSFMRFQRPETRFDDKGALQAQITRDAEEARAYFATLA